LKADMTSSESRAASPTGSPAQEPLPASQIEPAIQEIGGAILEQVANRQAGVWQAEYWTDRMMGLGLRDEAFKVQLFRFVDVLPTLQTAEQMARHLDEYFAAEGTAGPALLQWAAGAAGRSSALAGLAGAAIRRNVLALARRFIVAETPEAALPILAEHWRAGRGATVDLLGEKAVNEREALAYQQSYLRLIDRYAREMASWGPNPRGGESEAPRVNISVKLSSLYARAKLVDVEGTVAALKERLRPILRAARERGVFVCLDMEMYVAKDVTLRVFRELMEEPEFADFPHAGVAMQAYLVNAYADLEAFIAWSRKTGRRFTMRLVRGAYWDFETVIARQEGWPCPVFEEKWRTDENFERCCRLLMANHEHVRPAIGSHNVRSLAMALALEQALDLPRESYEFQMLYGMGDPIKRTLGEMGYFVRQYAPVGELLPGMAYLVRRLLENTSNESFLRLRFFEGSDTETLLRPPAPPGPASAEPPLSAPVYVFQNEPKLDFSRAENREAIARAVARVAEGLPVRVEPLIEGEAPPAPEGQARLFHRVNPSHPDRVVGEVRMATIEEAERAVNAANAFAPTWGATPPEERAGILRRAGELIASRRHELCALMVHETGKTWPEADLDVVEAVDFLRYYALQMERLGAPRATQSLPGEDNWLHYGPRGVAVVIAPWNFPLAISTGMTSAALVTGNAVIYKPAEQSSVVGWTLVRLLHEAGIPPGALAFLPGYGEEVGRRLVSHPWVHLIAFTGSREVGLDIVETAARTLPGQTAVKKVIAEMGGKNAIIVDDDADLDEAVRGVLHSAFGYQGQKCSAASRVIALPEVHDRLMERLGAAIEDLRLGPAEDPATDLGPLIDADALEQVLRYIDLGKREARLVAQTARLPSEGFHAPPTLFANVPPKARIAQEEIFGPVVALLRAGSFEEALAIANGTPYGLTGGVYSRSPRHIEQAKREFRVGNLYINRAITGSVVERQPFGGLALSGVGSKAGGPDYLFQFLEPRTISENTLRQGFAPPACKGS
jgi:RHH-type proline utilization regulon transcriptional repressor/proline dehydrogenase/delta 1-pyrroline-5-carboxylate dehydrogenase